MELNELPQMDPRALKPRLSKPKTNTPIQPNRKH